MRWAHKRLHSNDLFYTLTPELGIAIMQAFDMLRHNPAFTLNTPRAAYYEFGVFKGYNLWFANRLQPHIEVHGFDSFAGMPPGGAHPHHARGQYAADQFHVMCALQRHGADMTKIHLHRGWFSPEFFGSLDYPFPPAGVAVIDCDLYASCVPVLAFLLPLLRMGTLLLFDDWFMEEPSEKTALAEFEHDTGCKTQEVFTFGTYGMARAVVRTGDKNGKEKDS